MINKTFKDLVVGDRVEVIFSHFLQSQTELKCEITKIEEVDEMHRKLFFTDKNKPIYGEMKWTVYNDATYDLEGDEYDYNELKIL